MTLPSSPQAAGAPPATATRPAGAGRAGFSIVVNGRLVAARHAVPAHPPRRATDEAVAAAPAG